jgi:hypothetical protein
MFISNLLKWATKGLGSIHMKEFLFYLNFYFIFLKNKVLKEDQCADESLVQMLFEGN